MRVVGGKWRGRALAAPPPDAAIRPTTDRARETLFNVLSHDPDVELDGARVLDLFAGTGALGFEALSRGAASCLFVDRGVVARALIRQTIDAFGCGGIARLHKRDATKLGDAGPMGPYDLVFLDPPYGKNLGEAALASARDGDWIARGARVVLEEARDAAVAWPDGFTSIDDRRVSDTMFYIAEYVG